MSVKTDIKKVLIALEADAWDNGENGIKTYITPYLERIMKIVEASE